MRKQAFNPFLPLNEYIPDGEPHVFGDRVYLYGSHDLEGGYTFCMQDYVVYSAPVDNLTDWRLEGVTYRANQDPDYSEKLKYMYAPDVVKGNDGKYYLYYCMGGDYGAGGYQGPISVAVCDTPAGNYEYLGHIQYKDGTPMKKYICFDPAALNDNGTIRVYYGTQYGYEEDPDFDVNGPRMQEEVEMFGRSKEEIMSYEDSIMGPVMVVLEDDMLTVREDAKHIIPYRVKGTSFETHPFFEGSSMRKVGDKYYFIYSSWQNHELCYAISDYPDKEFTFGGTIVSNGDVGLNGRLDQDKLNMTGTTHGSIEQINGEWYVFFHRLTHKSDYSRQACAQPITIASDGSIAQVELTSCGLNGGPLSTPGTYPAVIACNLTNGHMPHGSNSIYPYPFPNVTHKGTEQFIAEIEDGTLIGYKYFDCKNVSSIQLMARIENEENRVVYEGPIRLDERCEADDASMQVTSHGVVTNIADAHADLEVTEEKESYFEIYTDLDGDCLGVINISSANQSSDWQTFGCDVTIKNQVVPIYLIYRGCKRAQLKEIRLV